MTLVQTGKSRARPILLFGRAFWEKLIDFQHLVDSGMISAEDLGLFHYVETAEQAWERLAEHYGFDLSGTVEGDYSDDS
jgi:predicted Rossmann-fold nucleotide-binding protein